MKSFLLSVLAILSIGLVLDAQPPLRSQPRNQTIPRTGPNPSPVANPPDRSNNRNPATSTSTPQAIANGGRSASEAQAGTGEQVSTKPIVTVFYQKGKRDRLIAVDSNGKYLHRAREIFVYLYCGYTDWQGKIIEYDGLYKPADVGPPTEVTVDSIIEVTEEEFKQIVSTGHASNLKTDTSGNTPATPPATTPNNNPDRIFER